MKDLHDGPLCVVVGTRPEIIKMASVLHELRRRNRDFIFVHSGQHYDKSMSKVFTTELELPDPDFNLGVGSGTHAEQTGHALVEFERCFQKTEPSLVMVEGDTNTVLAAALAAAKLGLPIAHVEAGVRCYDSGMPEEQNRRLTDHLSLYLFAPTERAASILRKEACWGDIVVTGNTVIDAAVMFGSKAARTSRVLADGSSEHFSLVTCHRSENVDNDRILSNLCKTFADSPVPVIWPIHPRTRSRIERLGLWRSLEQSGNVAMKESMGYLDFLYLMMKCDFIMTDSGGIQQEVCAPNIRKKVFVLREVTESPESVEAGFAEVVGTNPEVILRKLNRFLTQGWIAPNASPFGIGDAAIRILDRLEGKATKLPLQIKVGGASE